MYNNYISMGWHGAWGTPPPAPVAWVTYRSRVVRHAALPRVGYLKQQEVPMVIVSHDREFLDQLCTKIVETEFGVATTYKGNYTAFTNSKAEAVARQWAAYEKQQKEIARQVRP